MPDDKVRGTSAMTGAALRSEARRAEGGRLDAHAGAVPLVDTHAHVFHRGLAVGPAGFPVSGDFPVEDYIAELDHAGVRYGCIAAASFLASNHAYTRAALERHDRLRATINAVPSDAGGPSIPELVALDGAGVVGLRLAVGPQARLPDLRTPGYRALFATARDLGWHVHVYGRAEQVPPLLDALLQTGLNVVIDHFGARDGRSGLGSAVCDAVLRALETGRAWVKLSAPYLSPGIDHAAMAARYLEVGGVQRLLWGSDWPFVGLGGGGLAYRQTLSWLEDWLPDPATRCRVHRNAHALYRLPATEHPARRSRGDSPDQDPSYREDTT